MKRVKGWTEDWQLLPDMKDLRDIKSAIYVESIPPSAVTVEGFVTRGKYKTGITIFENLPEHLINKKVQAIIFESEEE